MAELDDSSVDMILCDLPYNTTAAHWDKSVIDLERLWSAYKRILRPNKAVVLFGSQPFTTHLIMSNLDWFKYEWIWEKGRASGFVHAKNKPLKAHENIVVFSGGTTTHASQSANRMPYYPQMESGESYTRKIRSDNIGKLNHTPTKANIDFIGTEIINSGERYPRSVKQFKNHNVGNLHPTQKPLALCEYLIKTYTLEGDTVLDNCMGSGTSGQACINTKRNFIGIELDEFYFNVCEQRLTQPK